MLRLKSAKLVHFNPIQKCLATAPVDVSSVKEISLENSLPFSGAKIGAFFQNQPVIGNQYLEDTTLRSYLKRWMPSQVFTQISPDLQKFGERVVTDLWQLHLECDKTLPKLEHYNAWGQRVDNIITCNAWKKMKEISAEEGLVAIAYHRKYAEWSRLYQIAKLYLYSPSAGLYTCPLAMTDGAARSLEILGTDQRMKNALKHLTSRDPSQFWTSGQWMTERRGGSDVAGGTETLAVRQSDGSFNLYGYKWFTSATDSDMSLTLARIVDDGGNVTAGTQGLTMFYVEVRDADGNLNNIQVQRLKDKLGTRQVPTAELLLSGTKAYQVSEAGRGVASIAHMLLLTRLYNSMSSVACMRRQVAHIGRGIPSIAVMMNITRIYQAIHAVGIIRRITNLARDYSKKRECFGHYLDEYPVHIQNLSNMEIEARSALILTLEVARLLGREECGIASQPEKDLLRILTPLAKLYTAKQAVAVASEGLESFGGMGYMEDTGLPGFLRDAQVLPIWEGTTNILSLDVLRALSKSRGAILETMRADVQKRLSPVAKHAELGPLANKVRASLDQTCAFARKHTDSLDIAARDFAFSLARIYMGMLLLEHAVWSKATTMDVYAASRWCERDLTPVLTSFSQGYYDRASKKANYEIVFDGYGDGSK